MSHLLPCFFLSTFSTFTMSQWLVDQTPRTAARNGVRNNTFWFIIPNFHCTLCFIAPRNCTSCLLWLICGLHCAHSYCVWQRPVPIQNLESMVFWRLLSVGMQRTCHKQVHAFIVLNLVSFRNIGRNKINILYELGTNKINILFELGTLKHSEYMMDF
jgi:hypothetical protein